MTIINPKTNFSVTVDHVLKVAPLGRESRIKVYYPHLIKALQEFEINNPLRVSAFLAQLVHESAHFKYMEEIADGSAYEGRKDLGNVIPGDGKRYKGRGPIQLTGRANYRSFGKELGVDLENSPELAASPEIGFRVAGCFWKRKGLNELADSGQFKTITKKINGGFNGLNDRINNYSVAKDVFGVK